MKNPLIKRLPRELIGEFPKYIVIFLFYDIDDRNLFPGISCSGNSMNHSI